MSDSHVTQCPHCRTSFRVSQAQLAAAHGAVRCGACLHVFHAARHLIGPQPSAPRPTPAAARPAAAAKPAPQKVPVDTLWIHDDLDLDSLDLDEELAKVEEQEQRRAQQAAKPVPEPAAAVSTPIFSLVDGPQDLPPQPAPTVPAPEPIAPQPASTKPVPTPDAEAVVADDAAEREPSIGRLLQDDPEVAAPVDESRSEPGLGRLRLAEIEDEPLQLEWQPRQGIRWGRVLGWSVLNLLAAAGLVAQYATYNFEALSRQDAWRPWFEQICPQLGCQLPAKVDISQIRSSNLVVRSHPQFSGALVVDAILYNRAPFAQPFPLLEMRFTDLGGQLVASRQFKPSEYLAGELAGQSDMPPQTPIHIALDILDPGPNAVNYSLNFHSPQ